MLSKALDLRGETWEEFGGDGKSGTLNPPVDCRNYENLGQNEA